MSVYPRNMSAFLNRLSGYNKNNVKMNVLGSSTANHGDVIQVDLPTNSIVDLSSLAWSFQVVYTGAAGTAATGSAHSKPSWLLFNLHARRREDEAGTVTASGGAARGRAAGAGSWAERCCRAGLGRGGR